METDEPPAPWSAHFPTMDALDAAPAEPFNMTLESVVPVSVVPEVERLLKVCCNNDAYCCPTLCCAV